VQMNVYGQGLVLDCDFVEGAKCREKIFWLCAIDLVLEEGSSA
jgi:hypothetical protein